MKLKRMILTFFGAGSNCLSLLLELHRDSIVKILEPHICQNIVAMAGADSWRQRNAVVLGVLAVVSVKDLFDLEVGEFSIVNAVL